MFMGQQKYISMIETCSWFKIICLFHFLNCSLILKNVQEVQKSSAGLKTCSCSQNIIMDLKIVSQI